jgi:signal transduction histidine kinase
LVAAEERNQLARDLHDSVAQAMFSINLYTEATEMALRGSRLEVAMENMCELRILIREVMTDCAC